MRKPQNGDFTELPLLFTYSLLTLFIDLKDCYENTLDIDIPLLFA